MSFIENLNLVVRLFKKHNISYCLAGGFALIVHGVNRGTQDLDFFISVDNKDIDKILSLLQTSVNVQKWEMSHGLLKVYIYQQHED